MDSDIDERVKIPLITDTLKICGVEGSLRDYNKKVDRDIEESLNGPHYRYSSSKVNNLYQSTPNDYMKCNDIFDLQDHLNGTEAMYHPCELGGYKMIFPFNQESLSNSIQLANNSCKDNVSNEFMRKVIDDIRQKQNSLHKLIRSMKSSNTLEKPKLLYQMNPALKPKSDSDITTTTDSTTKTTPRTNGIKHSISYKINISSNEEKLSEYAKKYEKKPSTCPSSNSKIKKDIKLTTTTTSTTSTTNNNNNNSSNNNNISTRKSEEIKSSSRSIEKLREKEKDKKTIPPAPIPIEKEMKDIKWKVPKLPVKNKDRYKGVDKVTIDIYTNAFKNIKKSNIKPPTKAITSKKMLPELE